MTPEMQAVLAELAGRPFQMNPANLETLVKRTTRGFVWRASQNRGRMPFLNEDQILQLKDRVRQDAAIGRVDFVNLARDIRADGLRLTAKWLRQLHHPELAKAVDQEVEEDPLRSRTWVNRMVELCVLVLTAGEQLETERAKWAKTQVLDVWFRRHTPHVNDVPELLRLNGDEVGVGFKDNGKLICLPGTRLFRLAGRKFAHFTVFPVFNAFGQGPPPFIVMPNFVSAQRRFQAIHRRRAYLAQSRSGWVTHQVIKEWAEWVCEWLDKFREEQGLPGHVAVLFLDNAPTRSNMEAMEIFRMHNVRVILLPPHLTHVLQPVDVCWAKQFKAAATAALRRYESKPVLLEAAFRELREDISRAPEKHKERVRIVYSIGEAFASVTVMSSAAQGFWHAGLSPWNAAIPLASPFITDGDAPGPLPVCPFEEEPADVAQRLAGLFDWVPPEIRPAAEAVLRFQAVPCPRRRRATVDGPYRGHTRRRVAVAAQLERGPAAPNLAESDSDGEAILVAQDATLAEVELLDVDALAVEDADGADAPGES